MSLAAVFHEDARSEFDEAAAFYNMERAGLGVTFVDAVELAVAHICEYPESCPVLRGRVRKMRVRKFPFSVLYSAAASGVRVLAVAHDRRRPFYWSGRR